MDFVMNLLAQAFSDNAINIFSDIQIVNTHLQFKTVSLCTCKLIFLPL